MYRPPPLIFPLLYPPRLAFGAVIGFRNRLYSNGHLQPRRLPRPVISIGNITMGGSGKTPLVIFLAGLLARAATVPALLSRGYGRTKPRQTHVLPPEAGPAADPRVVGDEPALIRRYRPEIWLGISSNRYQAGNEILIRESRAVFLLDDGFQHRALWRDVDVVVIDPLQPLQNNHLFPMGSLREPLSSLQRAQAIVINGKSGDETADSAAAQIRKIAPQSILFYCTQKIASFVSYQDWMGGQSLQAQDLKDLPAYLVTAVGNPRRFEADVAKTGVKIRGSRFYRDHFGLKSSDWLDCAVAARKLKAEAIIITEKDAIKIVSPPNIALFVALQSVELVETAEWERMLHPILEAAD